MSRRRGTGAALAFVVLLALAGCGRDDFKNDPKPPVPLEATIEITDRAVDISPAGFGAGLVNFVIANNSGADAAVAINGPTEDTTSPIPSNGNGVFKVETRPGDYRLSVAGNPKIKPVTVTVGPEREPSNNDLLLP
jgi:hypothetical protein